MATDDIPQNIPNSPAKQTLRVWEEGGRMINKTITILPSVYKTFKRLLLAAAGSKQGAKDIHVTIKDNMISVWCDGEGAMVPSIFRDACYHFLTECKIHTIRGDEISTQVFKNEKEKWDKTTTKSNTTTSKSSSEVSFQINLAKCGTQYVEDTLDLMKTLVVDFAGCSGLNVELNAICPAKTFAEYVDLYLETSPRFHAKVNDRYEICVGIGAGLFKEVWFMNSIAVVEGGLQVDYVGQITDYLAKTFNLKQDDIKRHLSVFVNERLDNPNAPDFNSRSQLTPDILEKIADAQLIRRWDIAIPDDALLADTIYSHHCTLIIAEGRSATEFSKHALSIIGAKTYGVFSLTGNLLNVIDENLTDVKKNAQIQNMLKMLGENVDELRYGKVMIMADQDYDGSRIKGQVINLCYKLYPSLLKMDNFLEMFITPIIKATHKTFTDEDILFYTMREYDEKKQELRNDYIIKYFKGLGCHNKKEATKYFMNFYEHIKHLVWDDDKRVCDALEFWFRKKKSGKRNELVREFLENPKLMDAIDLDIKGKSIGISKFFDNEYKDAVLNIVRRSIPSQLDGLTRVRRKILHSSFEYISEESLKIYELGGFVSKNTVYRHGNDSLESAIKLMATSTNINLLELDSCSNVQERYANIKLSPITRYLFHKDDELILNYLIENGQSIEPAWFIPIIPMVLANGAQGIAPGLRTWITSYNPREIIANLERLLKSEAMLDMVPWCNENLNTTTHNTANMYVLDANGQLKKYDTPGQLLEDFYDLRLDFYKKRKTYLLQELEIDLLQLEYKEKFAIGVWKGDIIFSKQWKPEMCAQLKEKGFKSSPSIEREARKKHKDAEDVEAEGYVGYDYLLSLFPNLHRNYIKDLKEAAKEKDEKLKSLIASTPNSLWQTDLAALDKQLTLEKYPEATYTEEEKRARAERAGDAAGQSA